MPLTVFATEQTGEKNYETIAYTDSVKDDSSIVIISQPCPDSAKPGEKAMVSVEAEGDSLRYTWYYKDAGKTGFTKSTITSKIYELTIKASNANRVPYCVITDAHGNCVTTDTVNIIHVEPLDILRQPEDAYAVPGENAVVSVEASGYPLTYKWYYRNKGSQDFTRSSITSDTYTLTMSEERNGREVYCVITDAHGNSVTTDTVTLNLAVNESLQILTQPCPDTALPGEQATIFVEAKGDVVLRDCSVIAEADYTGSGKKYTSHSRGIYTEGDLELNNCYVWGAHSGVTSKGNVTVNGGTYESYGHGSFYLAGPGTTSYFYDASLKWAPMRTGTVADSIAGTNNAAFYIGGANGITAYFDNCSFQANNADKSYCLILRSSGGESNNCVYVSNSNFSNYNKYAYRTNDVPVERKLITYSGIGNTYSGRVFQYIRNGVYTEESYEKSK